MPKRVIDFDAMWGSDKIAACMEWAQAEYAWLYGLADPSGCFELTNLRVIWGRVAAIRRNLTIERLEQVFGEFQDKGLLFVWEHEGKRYGHWTGSDVPGRLPPPSWRMRLERLAPPVPKLLLAEYVSRFARGRAASPGGGFLLGGRSEEDNLTRQQSAGGDSQFEISDLKEGASGNSRRGQVGAKTGAACVVSGLAGVGGEQARVESGQAQPQNGFGGVKAEAVGIKDGVDGLKGGVEEAHAQDLGLELGLGLELNLERDERRVGVRDRSAVELPENGDAGDSQTLFSDLVSKTDSNTRSNNKPLLDSNSNDRATANGVGTINGSGPLLGIATVNGITAAVVYSAGKAKAGLLPELKPAANEHLQRSEVAQSNAGRWKSCGEGSGSVASLEKPGDERRANAYAGPRFAYRDKAEQLASELRVGEGPSSLGIVRVRPEAIERDRQRAAKRAGSRSP